MKKPILIVTNPRWSQDTYVVFDTDNENELIPSEWVSDRIRSISEHEIDISSEGEFIYAPTPSFNEMRDEMLSEFFSENDTVDKFWPKHNILASYKNGEFTYYRYNDDGGCKYLTEGSLRDLISYIK